MTTRSGDLYVETIAVNSLKVTFSTAGVCVHVHLDGAIDLDVVFSVDLGIAGVAIIVHINARMNRANCHVTFVERAVLHVKVAQAETGSGLELVKTAQSSMELKRPTSS